MIYLQIYLIIGIIPSIILARHYVLNWRLTPSKHNVVLPYKIINRLIDSVVYIIALTFIIFLYPIYIIEIIIKKEKFQI